MRTLRIALLAFALALAASAVSAQVPAAKAARVADAAIGRLRSPFCPGLMLEVCPSEPAEALRDTIRMMAARGMPARAIVEDVLARHGEQWRAVPRRSGAGLWAWLLPPAVLLAGLVFIWRRMRRMRGEGRELAVAGAAPLSPAERAELDAALRDFERAEVP